MHKKSVDFKASMVLVLELDIKNNSFVDIKTNIEGLVSKSPDFYRHAPVVLSIADNIEIDFLEDLISMLKDLELNPISIRTNNQNILQQAKSIHIAATNYKFNKSKNDELIGTHVNNTKAEIIEHYADENHLILPSLPKTTVITEHVRSGVQISVDGDLVVLNSVSHGAEILATGSIHVYGALRGRAKAGITGDTSACIYVQSLEAELLSIANIYITTEHLNEHSLWHTPVYIRLVDEDLLLTSLYNT